jgi:type VI secretion system secreted protein Hcp
MAIYLQVEGLDGDVTAAGHEGWIECQSMDTGVGRGIETPTGSSQERESTAPSLNDITVTKVMDKCTPLLFTEACVGKGKMVKIDMVQTGDQLETYMSYILTDAQISSYAVSAGTEGKPLENVSFNFTKIEMKYIPFDNKGNPLGPVPAGYDVSLGKKI